MSSIVIAGDTSGSVTLQAPAVSGSTVLNLPSTSGTIQTSGAGYTTNGVAYATNATGLVTGSALVFDGTNLGIGTSSPSYKLNVVEAKTLTPTTGDGQIAIDNTTSGQVSAILLSSQGTRRAQISAGLGGTGNDGYLAFTTRNDSTGFAERARIDSSGNLCIGRTSVYSTNAERLSVQATGNSPAILAINAAGATDYTYVSWNSATTGDNKFVGFFTEASPTLRGSIDYNRAGGVTRYNTSSDATLKNINGDAPKQISINILNSTKIREYSWKDDATNKVQIGVIAQELHETFKGAVSVGGDKVTTDAEGNETTEYVPWAVDKTAFTFHLVAGWQEHERIIQEQQALITTLTDRISVLENK